MNKEITDETKAYLKQIFTVLRFQSHAMSLSGLSHERSRLGILNDRTIEVIRVIVQDDEYLYALGETDRYTYLENLREQLRIGQIEPPLYTFSPQQKELLIRLAVLFEWEKVSPESENSSAKNSDRDIGLGTVLTRELIFLLVNRDTVATEFDTIKSDPEKIEDYSQKLRFDLKDLLSQIRPHF